MFRRNRLEEPRTLHTPTASKLVTSRDKRLSSLASKCCHRRVGRALLRQYKPAVSSPSANPDEEGLFRFQPLGLLCLAALELGVQGEQVVALVCPDCEGFSREPDAGGAFVGNGRCSLCTGSGVVSAKGTCPRCTGTGGCITCGGSGLEPPELEFVPSWVSE